MANLGFRLLLYEASPGVKFDANGEGGLEEAICDIVIMASQRPPLRTRCTRRFGTHAQWKAAGVAWKEQLVSALYCNGSIEDQAQATLLDWFFHTVSLFWKLLFSAIAPPHILGGWACFYSALFTIGLVTAFVGEIASLLGCSAGMPDEVTAITLVAMGTSLPDTFASKAAAMQDDTADNSIGNIMGSNSVNVFLGLGLPWMIAAIFWQFAATCEPGDSWSLAYPEEALKYPDGIFVVKAGSLSLSVMVFCCCGGVCIATLALRRKIFKGELGGPTVPKVGTSLFFTILWVAYIAISILFED
mmetsp:Transcript_40919/g.118486  ORF Transcript_40919/g.118486 Transcript_40919/m.118486 type:complete len:302 (-) Transcript_40919:42-947(-)